MIQNNLHPDVAETPKVLWSMAELGGRHRNWECYDQILASLKQLEDDQTLLIQSGKPLACSTLTKMPQSVNCQLQPCATLGNLGAF